VFCRAFLDVSLPARIDQPWYTMRAEREWQEDELEGNVGMDIYMPAVAMLY
jgi:hypothetical protein